MSATQFCEAVDRGDIATVREMLRERPELVSFEWPKHGETRPVHIAVMRRDGPIVKLLMENGANAREGIWPNRDATGALTIATERGYDDIVAIIREAEQQRRGSEVAEAPDPLFEIDTWESGEALSMLQADPALIHSAHHEGATPLHAAAATLNQAAVEWLLEQGADPNCRARNGWTPLDLAASGRGWGESGSPDRFRAIADVLRRRGAELADASAVALGDEQWVRERHAAGLLQTATSAEIFRPFRGLLTIAVKHDRPEMLALLLDLGLDPDERVRVEGSEEVNYSASMPLYTCAKHNKLEMAEMLLKRGADPNEKVFASGSPTFVAYTYKNWEMVKLLEKHGGLLDAASVGYLRQTELARKMLAGEVDPRLVEGTFSGETVAEQLLWSGASGGDAEIVRMSLDHVDWKRDDPRWFWMLWRPFPGHCDRPEEERPLFLACFRLILERCDPNLRAEQFGQTMLHEAVACDHQEGVGFATALLDAGARLDIRDDLLQSTPLGWACRWGRLGMVKLFLDRGADPVEADAEPWATPRAWAKKKGHPEILALLEKPSPPV